MIATVGFETDVDPATASLTLEAFGDLESARSRAWADRWLRRSGSSRWSCCAGGRATTNSSRRSPTTWRSAVTSPAGSSTCPYEQSEAQNLLDDLRYTVSSTESSERLATVRDRAGTQLAAMLDAVPGLGGILATDHSNSVVAHPPAARHVGGRTGAAARSRCRRARSGPVASATTGCCCSPIGRCASRATCAASRATDLAARPQDPVRHRRRRAVREPTSTSSNASSSRSAPIGSNRWRTSRATGRANILTVIERATLDEMRDIATSGTLHPRPRARPRGRDRDAPVGALRPVDSAIGS